MTKHVPVFLVVSYLAMVLGGILLHFFHTGDFGTLLHSLTRHHTIMVVIIGGTIAFGLLRQYAWAWWLGLIICIVQLLQFAPWFWRRITNGHAPLASWIIGAMLIAFLVTMLNPNVRRTYRR